MARLNSKAKWSRSTRSVCVDAADLSFEETPLRLEVSKNTRFPRDVLGPEDFLDLADARGRRNRLWPAVRAALLPAGSRIRVTADSTRMELCLELSEPLSREVNEDGVLLIRGPRRIGMECDRLGSLSWRLVEPAPEVSLEPPGRQLPEPLRVLELAEFLRDPGLARRIGANAGLSRRRMRGQAWRGVLALPIRPMKPALSSATGSRRLVFAVEWGDDAGDVAPILDGHLELDTAVFETRRAVRVSAPFDEADTRDLVAVRCAGDSAWPQMSQQTASATDQFSGMRWKASPVALSSLGPPLQMTVGEQSTRLIHVRPAEPDAKGDASKGFGIACGALGLRHEFLCRLRDTVLFDLGDRIDLEATEFRPERCGGRGLGISVSFRHGSALHSPYRELATRVLVERMTAFLRGPCELRVEFIESQRHATSTHVNAAGPLSMRGCGRLETLLDEDDQQRLLELWPRIEAALGNARRAERFLETFLAVPMHVEQFVPENSVASSPPSGELGDQRGALLASGLVLGGVPSDASRTIRCTIGPLTDRQLLDLEVRGWCARVRGHWSATQKLELLGRVIFPVWLEVIWVFEEDLGTQSGGFILARSVLGSRLGDRQEEDKTWGRQHG